jgi:competence CoiA-like predicted nuclease
MKEFENSLEFKRHEHEFYALRDDLKRIQQQSVECKKSIGSIKVYFNEVNALFNINSSYVYDKKKIEKELESINDKLNDSNYLKDIKNLTPTNEYRIKEFEYKLYKRIDKILRYMAESFVNFELRPKPIKTAKSILNNPNLSNEERRQFYALKQMGIDVKDTDREDFLFKDDEN